MKTRWFNQILKYFVRKRSEIVVSRILPYLKKTDKIIDIGSGTGDVAILLRSRGMDITPVDVDDFHGVRLLETTIYDGKTLPFPDKSFDTALLLMVMHHTPNPDLILTQASRVARNIIVIETSYTTKLNRFWTIVSDALGNLRLDAFWNSYKTDEEWRKLFFKHEYKIIGSHAFWDRNFGLPFLHISYYLEH